MTHSDKAPTAEQLARRIADRLYPISGNRIAREAALAAIIETSEANARIADQYAHMVAGKEIAAAIRSGAKLEKTHD